MIAPTILRRPAALLAVAAALAGCTDRDPVAPVEPPSLGTGRPADDVDAVLRGYLASHGFTGRIASTLETRLGRRIDAPLADLGRNLFFDPIHGLNDDNTCAGCHSPTNGFGDTQSIAIGVANNGTVGPDRAGPRTGDDKELAMDQDFWP